MAYDRPHTKEEKSESFKELGFEDQRTLDFLAEEFGSKESLVVFLAMMTDLGFEDPVDAIKKYPRLTSYDLPKKVQDMKERGFKNPVNLICKFSPIAGKNMGGVIDDLTAEGFTNPVDAVERFPTLAGYGKERVHKGIRAFQKIAHLYHLTYTPVAVIESQPRLLSYTRERLFFFIKIAAQYQLDEKKLSQAATRNPYLLFALLSRTPPASADELMKMIRSTDRTPGAVKLETIQQVKETLPERIAALSEDIAAIDSGETNAQNKQKRRGLLFLISLARSLRRQMLESERKSLEARERALSSSAHRAPQFRIVQGKKKSQYRERTIPIPFDDTTAS